MTMFKRSFAFGAQFGRCNMVGGSISSSRINNDAIAGATQTQQNGAWENAKSLQEIPSPPKSLFLGNMRDVMKNMRRQHKFHEEMRKKYGNIVYFSGLGENVVCLYGPEHISTMYANDGKYPVLGGFENFEFLRYAIHLMT